MADSVTIYAFCRWCLGVVFLVAAYSKALDGKAFSEAVEKLGADLPTFSQRAAGFLAPLELLVGASLFLDSRPKQAPPLHSFC